MDFFRDPPSARERVAPLIAQADDLRAELAEALGQTPLDGVEVRVARGPEEMMTLAPQEALPATDPTGTAFAPLKLLILSLGSGGDPVDLVDAFRRELAHLALGEAVMGNKVPAWFSAGFAVHYSRESEWAREWSLLRAALRHQTEPVSSLDRLLESAGGPVVALLLAEGVDFRRAFCSKPEKHARFAATVERIRHGEGFESAIGSGYGADLTSLERHWRAQLGRRTTLTAVLVGIGLPAAALLAAFSARRMKRRKQLLRAKEQSEKQDRRGRPPRAGGFILSSIAGTSELKRPSSPSLRSPGSSTKVSGTRCISAAN